MPEALDPYRVAFTNEYAITSLFRRTAVEAAGGWRDPLPEHRGYEDWNLWMDLAERGERVVHLHDVIYRRRLHAPGLDLRARQRHAEIYCALRRLHPRLFAELAAASPPLDALARRASSCTRCSTATASCSAACAGSSRYSTAPGSGRFAGSGSARR